MKSAETSAISAGETHEVLEVREKGSLDRATIVKTALRLLDDVGIDGLSTRRLATELGIKSASLYWHFKDKDELLNEMSTVMLKECLHLGNANEPGFDAIKWLADSARAIRSTALSRRDGAQVMARPLLKPANMKTPLDDNRKALMRLGLTEMEARLAMQTIRRFAIGAAIQEQSSPPVPGTCTAVEGFEFGLKTFIDGLKVLIASRGKQ